MEKLLVAQPVAHRRLAELPRETCAKYTSTTTTGRVSWVHVKVSFDAMLHSFDSFTFLLFGRRILPASYNG